jgi:hypothetical protein
MSKRLMKALWKKTLLSLASEQTGLSMEYSSFIIQGMAACSIIRLMALTYKMNISSSRKIF